MLVLKTYAESSKSNIKALEVEIRKYCFNNNVNIDTLFIESLGLFQSRLYIKVSGEDLHIQAIKTFLEKISQ